MVISDLINQLADLSAQFHAELTGALPIGV